MFVFKVKVVEIKAVKPQNGNTNGLAGGIICYNGKQSCRAVLEKMQFQIIFSKSYGGDCLEFGIDPNIFT